jgi:hypothetical protein
VSQFYPLGYPVDIETEAPEVAAAAFESWGGWRQIFDAPALRIDVVVRESPAPPSAPRFSATPSVLEWIADEDNRAMFDCRVRAGRLQITRSVLERPQWFRFHFLEALVLTALDAVAFTPVHAACVAHGNRGLLLCGDSGAGKSSLAYACVRSGWRFVSDDAVHIAMGHGGLVVGNPRRLHLRPGAAALFPEIGETAPVKQPNGKEAIEVAVCGPTSDCTTVARCVFLSRDAACRTEFRPIGAARAREYFRKYLLWGDRRAQEADFDSILRHGCQELRYSALDDAIVALRHLMA